jgi:hypothetical protein
MAFIRPIFFPHGGKLPERKFLLVRFYAENVADFGGVIL